ncbi:hypothetical protein GAYE_SCF03G2217 [Galdieria yellowstonensis]|uniref:Uncharacterized protein n=1 Tax=Galdieria yellowstonensis TaxID=3028027 RepID=A0AAV9IAA7_9RHOD|nr:hypothetical protein GAYE_SCF03G2217 [Galdieria yellowstonensis]
MGAIASSEESDSYDLEHGSVSESCSDQEEASNVFIEWHTIFTPGTMKIDERYANSWLEHVPNLSEECSKTNITDLLGEKVKVANEEFSIEFLSLADASRLLVPRKFGEAFPLENSGTGISRVFLRLDLIRLWNRLMDGFDPNIEDRRSNFKVVYAPSGLGTSVYLYLIAVFARHFHIPVQYVANTTFLLEGLPDEQTVARKYAAMLLFMNGRILDNLDTFWSWRHRFDFLNGVPMKLAIYLALQRDSLELCEEVRENFMYMDHRKFIIVDEHHTLWQQFGDKVNSWPSYFQFFANPWTYRINRQYIFGGSQHPDFIDVPFSRHYSSIHYVEALSMREFATWQKLDDYPLVLKENCSKLMELSGLVPSLIAELVKMTRILPHFSFEKHNQYVHSLNDEFFKEEFVDMLYELFLSKRTPRRITCRGGYLDRGLVITTNRFYLRFCNGIARDILLKTFSEFCSTPFGQVELSKMLERAQRHGEGGPFDDQFFLWCLTECPMIELYSRGHIGRIQLTTNKFWRFDGKRFDPPLKKIMNSCWVRLCKNHAKFDYAYVDMSSSGWTLYLFKVAVSLVPHRNKNPTQLELLFSSESCRLALLLKSFFDESLYVNPSFNEEGKIVDFQVTDRHDVSYRDRIRVFYVTCLTREEAEGGYVPAFVELITFEDYPAHIKSCINEYRRTYRIVVKLRQRSGKRRNKF